MKLNKNRYVGGWIKKAEFLEKYKLFSARNLTDLITHRHKNGFAVWCKIVGNRAIIQEDLVAAWLRLQDEKQAA